MGFKGFVGLIVLALIIISYMNIKNHNPLSRDRYEERRSGDGMIEDYGSYGDPQRREK